MYSTEIRQYRHSSIYAVNVETQKENRRSKKLVNPGYLVVLKGRKIG
jgi:ribosome-associated protein YbcJ (S4-like RNA binding protein)